METSPCASLATARRLLAEGNCQQALSVLGDLKAARTNEPGVDCTRAECFVKMGQPWNAIEALKEELRLHPGHDEAKRRMAELAPAAPQECKQDDPEFRALYSQIRDYTMLSEERLWSLFSLARKACARPEAGNIVECGVAGGGSSALLAAVISRHSKAPRRLFACDSFEGLPPASARDRHGADTADNLGWGAGTCAAPESSLARVCEIVGVTQWVEPVKGWFSETLPRSRDRIGPIAMLHMDGDWYDSTRDILVNLYDAVLPGGFIQIDDYGYWEGCREAVADFQSSRGVRFDLVPIDITGVWFVKK